MPEAAVEHRRQRRHQPRQEGVGRLDEDRGGQRREPGRAALRPPPMAKEGAHACGLGARRRLWALAASAAAARATWARRSLEHRLHARQHHVGDGAGRRGRRAGMEGGAGAYSMPSWTACATASPRSLATTVRANIDAGRGRPRPRRRCRRRRRVRRRGWPRSFASISRELQWLAARRPRSKPAAPSTREPVQTEVT